MTIKNFRLTYTWAQSPLPVRAPEANMPLRGAAMHRRIPAFLCAFLLAVGPAPAQLAEDAQEREDYMAALQRAHGGGVQSSPMLQALSSSFPRAFVFETQRDVPGLAGKPNALAFHTTYGGRQAWIRCLPAIKGADGKLTQAELCTIHVMEADGESVAAVYDMMMQGDKGEGKLHAFHRDTPAGQSGYSVSFSKSGLALAYNEKSRRPPDIVYAGVGFAVPTLSAKAIRDAFAPLAVAAPQWLDLKGTRFRADDKGSIWLLGEAEAKKTPVGFSAQQNGQTYYYFHGGNSGMREMTVYDSSGRRIGTAPRMAAPGAAPVGHEPRVGSAAKVTVRWQGEDMERWYGVNAKGQVVGYLPDQKRWVPSTRVAYYLDGKGDLRNGKGELVGSMNGQPSSPKGLFFAQKASFTMNDRTVKFEPTSHMLGKEAVFIVRGDPPAERLPMPAPRPAAAAVPQSPPVPAPPAMKAPAPSPKQQPPASPRFAKPADLSKHLFSVLDKADDPAQAWPGSLTDDQMGMFKRHIAATLDDENILSSQIKIGKPNRLGKHMAFDISVGDSKVATIYLHSDGSMDGALTKKSPDLKPTAKEVEKQKELEDRMAQYKRLFQHKSEPYKDYPPTKQTPPTANENPEKNLLRSLWNHMTKAFNDLPANPPTPPTAKPQEEKKKNEPAGPTEQDALREIETAHGLLRTLRGKTDPKTGSPYSFNEDIDGVFELVVKKDTKETRSASIKYLVDVMNNFRPEEARLAAEKLFELGAWNELSDFLAKHSKPEYLPDDRFNSAFHVAVFLSGEVEDANADWEQWKRDRKFGGWDRLKDHPLLKDSVVSFFAGRRERSVIGPFAYKDPHTAARMLKHMPVSGGREKLDPRPITTGSTRIEGDPVLDRLVTPSVIGRIKKLETTALTPNQESAKRALERIHALMEGADPDIRDAGVKSIWSVVDKAKTPAMVVEAVTALQQHSREEAGRFFKEPRPRDDATTLIVAERLSRGPLEAPAADFLVDLAVRSPDSRDSAIKALIAIGPEGGRRLHDRSQDLRKTDPALSKQLREAAAQSTAR